MAVGGDEVSGYYISAAHRSSGKTVISIGICAALTAKNINVQAFKKGPDYIDPLWLACASKNNCYNLDFNVQQPGQIRQLFRRKSGESDMAVIEGNKGLHDGVDVNGADSNAALVKLLSLPVILVLDTRGTARGIAPLLLGYQQFDPDVAIAGVILNKVAGPRHESKLLRNIETHTDVKVIGAVPRDDRMIIHERYLGLIPENEVDETDSVISGIRDAVAENVNLDSMIGADRPGSVPKSGQSSIPVHDRKTRDLKIGVAKDSVFSFYYQDDVEAFSDNGAEVVYFDTLNDGRIPADVDGLFIGGGFPEAYLDGLGGNTGMKESIREFIDKGGAVYVECGGLMYLGQLIESGNRQREMVGALPVYSKMYDRPVGRGYVRLKETGKSLWGNIAAHGREVNAHEFHYSDARVIGDGHRFAYNVTRGRGIDGKHDGLIYKNVLASYSHLRAIEPVNWVTKFVEFARGCKS